jgi:hypothetical protein
MESEPKWWRPKSEDLVWWLLGGMSVIAIIAAAILGDPANGVLGLGVLFLLYWRYVWNRDHSSGS